MKAILVSILIAGWSNASAITISSEKINIRINNQFQQAVFWNETGQPFFLSDEYTKNTGLIINGKAYTNFTIISDSCSQKRIHISEFGPCIEAIVTGVYQDAAIKIERKTRILLPENFPDAVLSQTAYINSGKHIVRIDTVYTQNFQLKSPIRPADGEQLELASFQGGINKWGDDYSLIWLRPEFFQNNFQGWHKTNPKEHICGGMPFIDVWDKISGVALMHLAKKPQWLSLPVQVDSNGFVTMGIFEFPDDKLGQQQYLSPGESYLTVQSAIIFHHRDFYDALHYYGELLRCRGVAIKKKSLPPDFEPYWKTWGFGFDFTLQNIFDALPELRLMEIRIANIDDGWFQYYGDWDVKREDGKFPGGEAEIIQFVKNLHSEGFKTNIWWYPFGVSPESQLAKNRADLLVQAEDGSFPTDERGLYQLCPAYEPSRLFVANLIRRFVVDWDFDGLYTDTRGLAGAPPCYNQAHKHQYPLESFESMPLMYKTIDETLRKYKNDPYHEVCICAAPHSPYFMPYYTIANASDPINNEQVRRRIKLEKAIHGPTFCVGDCYQVPMDEWDGASVPESFESVIGTGGQLTTYYTDLDSIQLEKWKRMFHAYRRLGLSSAEYLNLYDIVFDKPEAHVVRKGESLYYGFFAPFWARMNGIEIRGLKKNQSYQVYDTIQNKPLGIVQGDNPVLYMGFKDHLLIKLTPITKEGSL